MEQAITLPSLLEKLRQGGYEDLKEVKEASVYDLTQELRLNKEEVNYLIKISGKEARVQRTIAKTIEMEREFSISTNSKNFNGLLGYGVPPFKITEICGESGSGKSQLCMQLAVNVQLGKVQGDCIYVDTEGSFQPSRIIQFAKTDSIEHILKGIHVFRVLNYIELIALIRQLPDILEQYNNVKLIIIDSIAYHFRMNTMDSKKRLSSLEYIAGRLVELANVKQLAVVATNHVTMDSVDQSWTPSLGSSWGLWCSNRLFLYRKRQYRYGYLYKSIENAGSQPVPFCIKDEGIMDPDEDELELPRQEIEKGVEINKKIESTWEDMKNEHIKTEKEAEQELFDEMWDENFDMSPSDLTVEEAPTEKVLTRPSTHSKNTTTEKKLLPEEPSISREESDPKEPVIHIEKTPPEKSSSKMPKHPTKSIVNEEPKCKEQNPGKLDLRDSIKRSDEVTQDARKTQVKRVLSETDVFAEKKRKLSTDEIPTNIPDDNEWASEEEFDLDFLENVHLYF